MRKLLKKYGFVSTTIVTDHLVAYAAAMSDLPVSGRQERGKRKNNRAESSHVPIRRRERKMQGFNHPDRLSAFSQFTLRSTMRSTTFSIPAAIRSQPPISGSPEAKLSPHGIGQQVLQHDEHERVQSIRPLWSS
jgi:transposase-like protein